MFAAFLCVLGGSSPRPLRSKLFSRRGCPILTPRSVRRQGGDFQVGASKKESAVRSPSNRFRSFSSKSALRSCLPKRNGPALSGVDVRSLPFSASSAPVLRALCVQSSFTSRVPHPNVVPFATLGWGFLAWGFSLPFSASSAAVVRALCVQSSFHAAGAPS